METILIKSLSDIHIYIDKGYNAMWASVHLNSAYNVAQSCMKKMSVGWFSGIRKPSTGTQLSSCILKSLSMHNSKYHSRVIGLSAVFFLDK